MRYETPQLVLIGRADAVVLGGEEVPFGETANTTLRSELVGYDE